MTKKRLLVLLPLVAGLGLGGVAAYAYLTTPEPAATVENFDRYVRQGMSQRQIEAVLGSPTDEGDETGRHFCEWACENGSRLKVYFEEGDLQAVEGWTLDNRDSIWVYALRPRRSLFDTIKSLLDL